MIAVSCITSSTKNKSRRISLYQTGHKSGAIGDGHPLKTKQPKPAIWLAAMVYDILSRRGRAVDAIKRADSTTYTEYPDAAYNVGSVLKMLLGCWIGFLIKGWGMRKLVKIVNNIPTLMSRNSYSLSIFRTYYQ